MESREPTYFEAAGAFRSWLAAHHAERDELLVRFWKKGTGRGGFLPDGRRVGSDGLLDRARGACHPLREVSGAAPDKRGSLVRLRPRPPGSRKQVVHWVMSAKRRTTRERRLASLIEDAAQGRKFKPLR